MPRGKLTPEQQDLAARAWALAHPVVRKWSRRWPSHDFEGEVAIRITKGVRTYRRVGDDASLGGWARTVAWRACLDLFRADCKRQPVPCLDDPSTIPSDDGRRRLDQLDAFAAMLRGMSRTERLIIIDRYWLGLTLDESGVSLGMAPTRIWQIHADLLRRLRERLGREAVA